jgi:hypothetical protein
MGNAPAIGRAAHDLLIDVIGREIARYSREKIDIAFADRFGHAHAVADCELKVSHFLPPMMVLSLRIQEFITAF